MPRTVEPSVQKSGNFFSFIADAGVLLDALAIATSLNFIGFNAATLEPHLRRFDELWLTILSLVFIGLGIAAKLVTAFISALQDSIHRRGFPSDISTYGLVSAMYFSANSIGAFIGPTLGGVLLDSVGYRSGTFVILFIDAILLMFNDL
ncbi:unnamed protein product [Oppiella nova]|uniref:Major facilitator superfamily (MFS) profile domain-containing protein n=1 Tax=Oppiella nova TaxID=334625 RepID=A0A7R9MB77_9ACAR|nr:unnamed protein product [Oppiella nova]CAG2172887.1 unnamed protein product [Oppiella nova]